MNPVFIKNRDLSADPHGFDALREEGLALVQAYSGNVWTDYNVHDPGVTILEHLCYGLTELIYRCGFESEDIFATESGFVPEAVGMYRPEDILPCDPVTPGDLRRYLYDRVDGVENVWVEAAGQGLWRIVAKREPDADAEILKEKLFQAYHGVRNLGEDLSELVVLEEDPVALAGEIEVDGSRPGHEILAEVYLACKGLVAPGIQPDDPVRLKESGVPLTELLEGPMTRHGVALDLKSHGVVERVSVTDVIGAVRGVPGVVSVKQLGFVTDEGHHAVCVERSGPNSVLALKVPEDPSENGVSLYEGGNRVSVSLPQFLSCYRAMVYEERRPPAHNPHALYELPSGAMHDFGEYTSIQNHFPDVYGINAFGVPPSYSEERKAAARQLKGYLSQMEQFLADGVLTLDSAVTLFSPEAGERRTAFSKYLTDTEVPDMKNLRPEGVDTQSDHGEMTSLRSKNYEKRAAYLSHLLSLYGEKVERTPLTRPSYLSEAVQQESHLKAQTALLASLPELSAGRFRGHDLTKQTQGRPDVSPFQKRCEILLGFTTNRSGSLTLPMTRDGLKLIDDAAFLAIEEGALAISLGSEGEELPHLMSVPTSISTGKLTCDDIIELKELIVPFQRNLIFESLLRKGTTLSNFRFSITSECKSVTLVFNLNGSWIPLGTAESKDYAVRLVQLLRHYLIFLNIATEGFHVVENVLLCSPEEREGQVLYIVCPNWTDRFSDGEFRKVFMEVCSMHLPAHLMPRFCFLGFGEMRAFEGAWSRWREAKRKEDGQGCVEAGKGIVRMLGGPPAAKG